MALKLAANLNFLFAEGSPPLAQRMQAAHRAGFKAVEIPYPPIEQQQDVLKMKQETGLKIALMNIALGPDDELRLGSASVPGAEEKFHAHLKASLETARLLDCKKLHIMSGLVKKGASPAECLGVYRRNLLHAIPKLQEASVVGVIEPINPYSVPNYFMNSYDVAAQLLNEFASPQLKLMVDFFHLQQIRGNVSRTLKEFEAHIGHFQIAQVPHRHEPNTPGELNFGYVFELLRTNGYSDWIGCEYTPCGTTEEGLAWIKDFGLQ